MRIKTLIFQARNGAFLKDYSKIRVRLRKTSPDFACFSEYFASHSKHLHVQASEGSIALRKLLELSKEFKNTSFIAGTVIEKRKGKYYNTCFILRNGKSVGKYRKVFLTKNELVRGITPGKFFPTFNVSGVRFSVMVCNDVLRPESSTIIAKGHPDIVFVPLVSPKRKIDPTKAWRDYLFVTRAFETRSYLVKIGSVDRVGVERLAGRSMVCAPWGIIWKSKNENKEEFKLLTLDLKKLNTYQKKEPLYLY